MAVEQIPIELDLKTAKSLRDIKRLQTEVKKTGKDAAEAGTKGSKGFAEFGKSALGVVGQVAGISAGLAGVIQLMRLVHERQLAINAATAENIRQQQDRLRSSALTLGGPLVREAAQQLDLSEVEAFRLTGQLSAQFDIPQAQVLNAVAQAGPRFERGQAPISDILAFARGTNAAPREATQLFAILRERFGQTGAAARRSAAGVGAVAKGSALSTGNLLRILTPVSAGLKEQGITDPVEQASIAAAFAQFEDPDAPELTKTGLNQLVRLSRGTPDSFTSRLLRDAGADPETFGLVDLITAYQKFLTDAEPGEQRRAKVRELSSRTGISPRTLNQVAKTAEGSFEEVRQRTLAAGRAKRFSDVRATALRRASTPQARTRSGETLERVRETVAGSVTGSNVEAEGILNRLISTRGAEDPERTQIQVKRFQAKMRDASLTAGEMLKDDESKRLFFLLEVWTNQVRPVLIDIRHVGTAGRGTEGSIENLAHEFIVKGDDLASESQDFEIIGTQLDFVNQFEEHIATAIQFIRRIQNDRNFGTSTRGTGATARQFSGFPTTAERGAAAPFDPAPTLPPVSPGSPVSTAPPRSIGNIFNANGIGSLLPQSNITTLNMFINGTDPATIPLPNRGTGVAVGEP